MNIGRDKMPWKCNNCGHYLVTWERLLDTCHSCGSINISYIKKKEG